MIKIKNILFRNQPSQSTLKSRNIQLLHNSIVIAIVGVHTTYGEVTG